MKLAKNLERLGTETAFSVLAEAKKLEAQGKEMIHLGLGQPDFMTPKHIMDAAKKAIDDGHHGYVLANGIAECRQAVSRKIKKLYKKEISPERIMIMPGGKPTMYFAIHKNSNFRSLFRTSNNWSIIWFKNSTSQGISSWKNKQNLF